MISKIQKLLALAGNAGSEAEAANAATRAAELMARHHIEEAALQGETRDVAAEPVERVHFEGTVGGRKKVVRWHATLLWVLAKATFCHSYSNSNSGLYLVGRKSDRDTVLAMFGYLRDQIDRLGGLSWQTDGSMQGENPRSWRLAFAMGAIASVKERLQAMRAHLLAEAPAVKSAPGQTAALVLLRRDEAVAKYVKENLKLQSVRGLVIRSRGAYEQGRAAGSSLSLERNRTLRLASGR
jgi:hypothetical protein